MSYMCTINCPYCVHCVFASTFLLFHSKISFHSDIFVQLFHNPLLLIIHVLVHYSDTRNVFWVFRFCSSVTHNLIIKQVNKHPTVQDLCLIPVQHRVFEGLMQRLLRNQDIWNQFLQTVSRRARPYLSLEYQDYESPCDFILPTIKYSFCSV